MQRWLLAEDMGRLQAEEIIRERGGSVSSKELYRLTLLATGDKRKAEEAKVRRQHEEMRAGVQVVV